MEESMKVSMEVSTAQAPMAGPGADWVPIGDVRWMTELLFPDLLPGRITTGSYEFLRVGLDCNGRMGVLFERSEGGV
ncbi:hypothetical protein CH63R_03606 [Colletotrichum higginsianum IMI 349063]|uniref:Uncharacterized protein n=1 Tax=Colletotrichum higginsianum (strain IMI 349063) TaxID=759273 RepID=A0A1B7YH78_COLHI|nr:hypothetical protein CH63R_03606 [Colletotrichum higginsianum IMI 349063]OBR11310.1 hypothetical protein CH63R_03606 [Colletotrichum higginsianum IMI 349063]GJC92958.1 hypothetical protein ColKHC_01784 [Colletotrichum higginsianum]